MPNGEVTAANVQLIGGPEELRRFLGTLGYNVSDPIEQTAASLGVAERFQHAVSQAHRVAAERLEPSLDPALEVYWLEVTVLTAELRKAVVGAFRLKPAQTLLILTTKDFDPIDFVLVQRAPRQGTMPGGPAISHRLFSLDRRNPTRVHLRVLNRMANTAADAYAQYDRIKDAFRLAEWSEDEFNNRNLFSDYFLKNRLPNKTLYAVFHQDVRPARRALSEAFHLAGDIGNLPTSELEKRLVKPLAAALGFEIPRSVSGQDAADYLLEAKKENATARVPLLVYPWDRSLDRKDELDPQRPEDVPGIRVVRALEYHSASWAILTNGKDWRLYCAAAHSRASNYYEIDLPETLEREDLTAFRYFYLFFRATAFIPVAPLRDDESGQLACFLDHLRAGSAAFAKEVGDRLRDHIFKDVFPYLAQGFVENRKKQHGETTKAGDPFLDEVYDATLTLLYRLLFLLYAESLDLVPVHEPAYATVSLTKLKQEIAAFAGNETDTVEKRLKDRFNQTDTTLYRRLADLFKVIDEGSKDHNVPAYNGGLFETSPQRTDSSREAAAARFLKKQSVPDFFLARAIDLLARSEDDKTNALVFVDYKSLGVRQLGNIYEGLLVYHVVIPSDDWEKSFQRNGLRVALVPSNKERKSSGSYFTPQHIVKYIVSNTVGPLLTEKFDALAPKLRPIQREYQETREFERKRAEKMRSQPRTDDAIAHGIAVKHEATVWDLFDLKVLDPAMGSGHFLVETVDFITDKVLDFLAGFPWNPVQVLIDQRIRGQIIESLDEQGVKINEDRLTDVNLIKRLVMKRCVYGVDLNPMAVELAKVSLWLDSFTLGAPLSFMDHHLKCGNSLIGTTIDDLKKASEGWMYGIPMEPLERATRNMEDIANLTDATLAEVTKSAETYEQVLAGVEGYRALLDCLTAEHFGVKGASQLVTEGGDLDLEHWSRTVESLPRKEQEWVKKATAASHDRRFFHWDIDFPDVFFTRRREDELKAFDAVVGNPPWGAVLDDEALDHARSRFKWEGSQRDTYLEFTEQAHCRLRSGGRYGMILPDAWLTGTRYEPFRKALTRAAMPVSVVDLPYDTFPEAYVDCAILTTKIEEDEETRHNHSVIIVKFANYERVPEDRKAWPESQLPLDRWLTNPGVEFALLTDIDAQIIARFDHVAYRFDTLLEIDRGLEAYGQKTPKEIRKRRGYHGEQPLSNDWWPQFSGTLRRYEIKQQFAEYVDVKADLAECPPERFFDGSRVLVRRMISRQYRLMAATASGKFAVDSSTLIARPKNECIGIHAIQTLINCAFFSFCQITKSSIAQRDDYPKVSLYEARGWPVPPFAFVAGPTTSGVPLPSHPSFGPGIFCDAHQNPEQVAMKLIRRVSLDTPHQTSVWNDDAFHVLDALGKDIGNRNADVVRAQESLVDRVLSATGATDLSQWTGRTVLDDLDYLGWEDRYPSWQPDDRAAADGRWFPNGVAPPLEGDGPGDMQWDLIARVYPSYPLPGIDTAAWGTAAWEQFVELLRKNKSKIGNDRIRADLTGRGAVENPTGPMRKTQETFVKFHRDIRENRAKAAEIDFLIDRIVFRLFDLTLDEQKLILSRVGPGRPLPPRRGRRKKTTAKGAAAPGLFE